MRSGAPSLKTRGKWDGVRADAIAESGHSGAPKMWLLEWLAVAFIERGALYSLLPPSPKPGRLAAIRAENWLRPLRTPEARVALCKRPLGRKGCGDVRRGALFKLNCSE